MSGIADGLVFGGGRTSGANDDTHTKGSVDYQRFMTTGSDRFWYKPAGVTQVYIEVIGGGGGGGTFGRGGSIATGVRVRSAIRAGRILSARTKRHALLTVVLLKRCCTNLSVTFAASYSC